MAIKIKDLETLAEQYTTERYVYKDLSLDLGFTKIEAPGLQIPTPGTDIKASYDLEAINNSLLNLFSTVPGERFLFPEYGISLKSFLFTPITVNNGKIIGTIIYDGIRRYEPRVNVQLVDVIASPDENLYRITIAIELPVIKKPAELNFIFDIKRESFLSLPVKN